MPTQHSMSEMHRSTNDTTGADIAAGQVATADGSGGVVWDDAAASLTVQDEGTPLATSATTLNFVGAGVTASGAGATKTITISGASTGVPPKILLESGHAVPFTFDEILQSSDGSDFLWASA